MQENAAVKEEPKTQVSHEVPKKTAKNNRKTILIIGITVAVILMITGIAIGYKMITGKKAIDANKNLQVKVTATADNLRSRSVVVSPAKDAFIQVFTDNKAVISLEIPKGSVEKQQNISITPYKDANNNLQVKIAPSTVAFRMPVSLVFDLSRTGITTDAPKVVGGAVRSTGKTQVVQLIGSKKNPTLIARGSETNKILTARILSGGTYKFVFDDSQIANARSVFQEKDLNSLNVLEAGSVLVFNNQNLSSEEKARIKAVADKILGLKNISFYEMMPAVLLQKKLVASRFFPQAYAADITAQYFEIRCKDRTLSIEEYVIAAQTAQATGHDDAGEKCLDAAKAKVADQARDVLGNPGASVSEILKMMAKTQMFGLDELSNALEQKLNKAVKDKVQETLNDPNATLEDLVKALQDAQVTGQDGDVGDQLDQRITEAAKNEVDRVLNDPNSNMLDVAKATQKAQAFGLENQSKQGLDRLQQMSKRSSEEILNSANPTAKELEFALGAAALEGKDMAYRNEIREKIKEAQKKESQPTPTPTPNEENPEDIIQGIDWGVLAEPMLQLIGINSLDEQTLKDWAKEKSDQGREILELAPEICGQLREMAPELYTGEMAKNCEYLEGGQAASDIQKAQDDVDQAAEEIGRLHRSDYEEPDESPHMEIEFTPTPEVEDESVIDERNQEDESVDSGFDAMDSADTNEEDSSSNEVGTEDVQGVKTESDNSLVGSILRFVKNIFK